jgi:hypothetical protein
MDLLALGDRYFLAPLSEQPSDPRQPVRERVLAACFLVLVGLGGLGYAAFLISDIIRGMSDPSYWKEIPGNTIAFLLILGLAFGRRLPFKLRAGGLVGAFYLAAFSEKFFTGQELGIGSLLLLVCAPLMLIFFGARGGWLAAALALLITTMPLWLGVGSRAGAAPVMPGKVVLVAIVLLLLTLLLLAAISALLRALERD